MNVDQAVDIGRAALMIVLTLCGPPLLVALVVGVVVSLLQAMTQLQDVTIGFVPRLIAVLILMVCLWPWMCERLVEYSTDLYREVPNSLSRSN